MQPRLTVSQTLTDNLRLSSDNKDAALITSVAPGVSINGRSGRVRGSLDYSLNGLIYTKTDISTRLQQQLNAKGGAEIVDGWLFLDGSASIGQQLRSAFGTASAVPNSSLINSNSTEVATLNLSPSVRGQLASELDYELRGDFSKTRVKDSATGDGGSRALMLRLSGPRAGRLISWSTSLRTQQSDLRGGRDSQTSSATATLGYRPDIDWDFQLTAGTERSDLLAANRRAGATYGFNARWTPGPRTQMGLGTQKHVYGSTHQFNFQHRMARSVWRYTDSRSINEGGAQRGVAQDLYSLLFEQFASQIPDPVERDRFVRDYMQANGLGDGSTVNGGFINTTPTSTRRQSLSMAWQNVRSSLNLSLSQSRSLRLGNALLPGDDFANSTRIQQSGISVQLSHRLTPQSSVSLQMSQQRSGGDDAARSTDLKSFLATWNSRLGQATSVQLGLRHSRFDSQLKPYRENALLATLVQQF